MNIFKSRLLVQWSTINCILIMIFSSCNKDGSSFIDNKKVHFYGQLYVNCDNTQPAKNVRLFFWRMYDNGIHRENDLGETYTDDNGYFSFTVEVNDKKDEFMYYLMRTSSQSSIYKRNYFGEFKSYNNSKDVEINGGTNTNAAFAFHIKNLIPFDINDELTLLQVIYPDNSNQTLIENLKGSSIDTVIYRFLPAYSTATYQFNYTKNGVVTNSPSDSLNFSYGLDTTVVDVFY